MYDANISLYPDQNFAENLWQEAHPVTVIGPLSAEETSFGMYYGITLLISLIEPLGYEAALILIPEAWDGYGHAAVGVNMTGASGRYYIVNQGEENGMGYYYAETTALGWKLGEMPDLNSYKAYVYEA